MKKGKKLIIPVGIIRGNTISLRKRPNAFIHDIFNFGCYAVKQIRGRIAILNLGGCLLSLRKEALQNSILRKNWRKTRPASRV